MSEEKSKTQLMLELIDRLEAELKIAAGGVAESVQVVVQEMRDLLTPQG